MAKEMTFDEALEILKGNVFLCSEEQLRKAIEIVSEKDPNHPALANVTYENNYKKLQDVIAKLTFDKFKSDNEDVVNILKRVEITDGSGDKAKALTEKPKEAYLSLLFKGAKMKAETVLAGDVKFAELDKNGRNKALKEEIKTIFLADLFQTAIASSLDKPTKKEQKIGTSEYRNYITRQSQRATKTFNNIIEGNEKIRIKVDSILSSCAETSFQVEQYINALKRKIKDFTNDIGKNARDDLQNIKTNVRDNFSKLATSLQTKKNRFEELANSISNNRYEIWKNIKGSFSDNKFKLIGNITANAAFGYWTATAAAGAAAAGAATPVLVPAIAAYAAYHAAGSWVFPIVAEMRKINRKQREAGKKPLKFKDALKQAWKNKINSRKDKRSYIVGGVLNTGLAVAGFAWLKDGLEAADAANILTEGAREGLNVSLASNIAGTRHAISLGRAGTATVAQLTDASIAYAVATKDPDNKEKRNEFRQAATSALIGLGFNVAFQSLGFAHGKNNAEDIYKTDSLKQDMLEHSQNTDTSLVNAEDIGNVDSLKQDNMLEHSQNNEKSNGNRFSRLFNKLFDHNKDNTENIAKVDSLKQDNMLEHSQNTDTGLVNAEVNSNETGATDNAIYIPFPETYNENMGISRHEYNILVKTTEGTLKSATGMEGITLDKAYNHLAPYMDEYFPGKTKEEVIYKFNRLYAFMRKAYEVGDGTLRETPSGHDYLESRFENLNLNLNNGKMGQLVMFAQENTYASRTELKDGLKELFPEGLSNKDAASIITTIHSNQRFYQYQQEMEALINLLGCGEKIDAQQAVAINSMLDKTNDILATGKENTQLVGLSLEKGCHDDDGEWRRITPVPVPVPEPEPLPLPELELELEPLSVPELELELEPEPLSVPELASKTEPVTEEGPRVRKVLVSSMSQLEGQANPEAEKILSEEVSARLIENYNQNSQ